MIFARVIFWIAGALGLAAIVPLYRAPGNATYYGLLATLIAWQCAFFVIDFSPVRFRPLMIPAVLEKVLWMITLSILYSKGAGDATIPDCKRCHPRRSRPAFYRIVCDHGTFEPPQGKLNVAQGIAA